MNFGKLTPTLAFIFLAVAATAQVMAQREIAAPEAPKKNSRSAARAQAERQRAAAVEAQRQRAGASAQAENARLAQQQAYANQQALVSNTVPPTAQADCYGSFERKNWSVAFVYCSADAAQGDADAQYNLGVMYDEGRGVAKDDAEAVRWYRKAADQGMASAQYNLGVMYDEGEGVTENNAEAVRWYRRAVAQGDADAKKRVAELGY